MLSISGFFFLLLSVCDFYSMHMMKNFLIDQDRRKEGVQEEKMQCYSLKIVLQWYFKKNIVPYIYIYRKLKC